MGPSMGMGAFAIFPALLLVFGLIFFVAHVLLCVWAYRDCIRRNKSSEFALLVLLLLFFFPIAGLIVYLLIRNS